MIQREAIPARAEHAAYEAAMAPVAAEQNTRGEFPDARANLMGISGLDSQSSWKVYDERLARVQEIESAFVERMVGLFPGQELTSEEIAAISRRNLGVVMDIGKNSLGKFCESKRDDSTIEDIRTTLNGVRLAQAAVMLGLEEDVPISQIHAVIRNRLPEDTPENEVMNVYCALKIPLYYQPKNEA